MNIGKILKNMATKNFLSSDVFKFYQTFFYLKNEQSKKKESNAKALDSFSKITDTPKSVNIDLFNDLARSSVYRTNHHIKSGVTHHFGDEQWATKTRCRPPTN